MLHRVHSFLVHYQRYRNFLVVIRLHNKLIYYGEPVIVKEILNVETLRHLEQPMHELHVLSKRKSSINWHIYLKFKITLGLHVSHPVDPYAITSCDMHCMVFWRTNLQFGEIFLNVTAIVLFKITLFYWKLHIPTKLQRISVFCSAKNPGGQL